MILQYIDSLRRGNADTLLYYYTVQSGILCFLYFFSRRFQPEKGEGRNQRCRNHVYSRDRNSLFVYAERCQRGSVLR